MQAVPTGLLVRAIAYGLAMAYLTMDLLVFEGPLHQRLRQATGQGPVASEIPARAAARIFGREIPLREVDQMVVLQAMRSGRVLDWAAITPELRMDLRLAALDDILSDLAVDAKLVANQDMFDETATDQAVAEEETRVGGPEALAARLEAAGLTRADFRARLRAHLARTRYLESRLESAGANRVDEAAVREFLDNVAGGAEIPARWQLRHIFKATLRRDDEEVRQAMAEIHRRLTAGEITFDAAAATESDDAATAARGGRLGWIEAGDRWPEGLSAGQFDAAPRGQALAPVRSRLGWHVFLVDGMEPARPLDATTGSAEIRAHLISEQRRQVAADWIDAIRREGQTVINRELLAQTPFTF